MNEQTIASFEKQAEDMLGPKERVMSQAMSEIMAHIETFQKAGIDESKVKEAAAIASEMAAEKFEQMGKEDPLMRIKDVLMANAHTEDDRALAEEFSRYMDSIRSRWIDYINNQKTRKTMKGEEFNLEETVKASSCASGAPTYVRDGRTSFDILRPIILSDDKERGRVSQPSKSFVEGMLKELGDFPGWEKLEDLKHLPSPQERSEGPIYLYQDERVRNLPSKIPGVMLEANISEKRPMIFVEMDLDAFRKIIEFPKG